MDARYPLIDFDPVAFSLGPIDIHWYGLMYLMAFGAFWWLGSRIARHRTWWGWKPEEVGDFLFYGMLGVIAGGRLGYVLFYGSSSLRSDPLFVFRIWDGGMSFHGGLLGVMLAMAWFARRSGRSFWQVADFVAPLVPLGLAFGRIGNFIGGELWGRLSTVPWAMIFRSAVDPGAVGERTLEEAWRAGALDHLARHPSQLYQAALEGLLLFALLMAYSAVRRPVGAVSGLFLLGYGCLRLVAELFREPDRHLGFIALERITMGMVLSLPMVIAGVAIMLVAYRRARHDPLPGG